MICNPLWFRQESHGIALYVYMLRWRKQRQTFVATSDAMRLRRVIKWRADIYLGRIALQLGILGEEKPKPVFVLEDIIGPESGDFFILAGLICRWISLGSTSFVWQSGWLFARRDNYFLLMTSNSIIIHLVHFPCRLLVLLHYIPARLLGKLEIFCGLGSETNQGRTLLTLDSSVQLISAHNPHIICTYSLQIHVPSPSEERLLLPCNNAIVTPFSTLGCPKLSIWRWSSPSLLSAPCQFLITSGYFPPIVCHLQKPHILFQAMSPLQEHRWKCESHYGKGCTKKESQKWNKKLGMWVGLYHKVKEESSIQ